MSLLRPLGDRPRPAHEFATLAGGCFWCLEAAYAEVSGVADVESGYANGNSPSTSYREVCTGTTGHAEVVRIEFDPALVSFDSLLEVFFGLHDPTTPDRQGADVGRQYRSAIFFHSPEQEAAARAMIATAQQEWRDPVVTEVEPVRGYSRAEDAHQEYFARNPQAGYCQVVVGPKVAKFRQAFARLRR